MPITPSNSSIVKRLIEAGIIPKLCTRFELTVDVDEPIRMTSECFVTEDQVREIAAALIENPAEAQQIARRITLNSPLSKSVSIDL